MVKDQLISWLQDAYAMEHGLIPVLQKHADDAQRELPEAAARIRQHITETRRHAERVDECLRILGASPAAVPSPLAPPPVSLLGRFDDVALRNAWAGTSAEHFEIACYRALALAATEIGEAGIAQACVENMRDEEQMALWLDRQLPLVVGHTLKAHALRR